MSRISLGILLVALLGLAWMLEANAAPFAYLSDVSGATNTVKVVDTASNAVVATVMGVPGAFGVAVNSTGTRVYTANVAPANSVSVIDTSTNTVIATVLVGSDPEGIAVTPDGSKIYVANSESNTVSVINASTNTIITTVAVGSAVLVKASFTLVGNELDLVWEISP
jgi:YVTN family beta-propeller protein